MYKNLSVIHIQQILFDSEKYLKDEHNNSYTTI